jgi:hypothetical protein
MTYNMRRRLRAYIEELPGALFLAILTAAVTILLALILSAVIGGQQRGLLESAAANGAEVVDHAKVARCESAYIVEMLRAIGQQSPTLDLSRFEPVNTTGLDCEAILRSPFTAGENLNALETPSP